MRRGDKQRGQVWKEVKRNMWSYQCLAQAKVRLVWKTEEKGKVLDSIENMGVGWVGGELEVN